MKKVHDLVHSLICIALSMPLIAAGCSSNPVLTPNPSEERHNTPTSASTSISQNQTASSTVIQQPSVIGLLPLPDIDPKLAASINDKDWSLTTTDYPDVSITYPSKGQYAISIKQRIISKNDPHLKNNCYITKDVVYEKTDIEGYAVGVCQTTTDFSADHGTRIDYFVIQADEGAHLITFTKTYSKGFDMNMYSATLDHVIRIID